MATRKAKPRKKPLYGSIPESKTFKGKRRRQYRPGMK